MLSLPDSSLLQAYRRRSLSQRVHWPTMRNPDETPGALGPPDAQFGPQWTARPLAVHLVQLTCQGGGQIEPEAVDVHFGRPA